MEDLAGGPMLRPPGIAPGGRAGNKEQSERGTPAPGLGLAPPPASLRPALSRGSDYIRQPKLDLERHTL